VSSSVSLQKNDVQAHHFLVCYWEKGRDYESIWHLGHGTAWMAFGFILA